MVSPPRSGDKVAAGGGVLVTARKFAETYIAPKASAWEREGAVPRRAFEDAATAGLRGILVPNDFGGCGLGFTEALEVLEALAGANAAFAFALWVHNNATNTVARSGTDFHRNAYLEDMLKGSHIGAFCLTEPDAGSDAAAITTHAERHDDGWTLNGTKSWVTNGAQADILLVFAQTNPGAGVLGIAAFLVPADRPGANRTPAYDLPGAAAFGLSDIIFEDCKLSEDDLLLQPGEGFRAAMAGINQARTFVGALCCGMLGSSLETALKYAASRSAFGKSTLEFQGVQWPLADVATDLEAARLLTRHAAEALDRGETAITPAAHAKKFASRAAFDGVSNCMQAMGAAGLRDTYPLSRHLVTAKMTHFLDGTTEIQNVVIARALMAQHGIKIE
ncbi:MAG: acyl-CoA dehydrogenase family protein [Hyphomicrobiaceae bacterium]|nr:acyl-CoA dehydrogenase family protein [Hyphomicrobiaceae bacterium]